MGNDGSTLSLCMIVKNEAGMLPDCLASARGLVDAMAPVIWDGLVKQDATVRELGNGCWEGEAPYARLERHELGTDHLMTWDAEKQQKAAEQAKLEPKAEAQPVQSLESRPVPEAGQGDTKDAPPDQA